MSTMIAALVATLITTGMTSAVSHQFTLVGGCVVAVMFWISALVSRNVEIYPAFFLGAIALSILALVSSEATTATLQSTVYVLCCYLALLALSVSSTDLSSFCRQLIMGNNLLLTGWILYQALKLDTLEAWQISSPSGAGNLMAAQINMTLPLVMTRIHESRGALKVMFLSLMAMNCTAVFLVMSRNGIGTMLIILTLYALFNKKRLAVGVSSVIIGIGLSFDSLIQLAFVHQLLVKMRFVDFSAQTPRSLIWQVARDHIWLHPMLGVGPGKTKQALAVIETYHAHNNVVQVVLESGIPAGVIFTVLMLLLLWLPGKMIFQSREHFVHTLPIIAYMGFSMTAAPLISPGATLLLAVCVHEARVAIQRRNQEMAAGRLVQRATSAYRVARAA